MTIEASHCEAILRGMSKQVNKDGDWIEVKFQVHPQEVPQALWDAALRSRWQLAFVEIGDDETPVEKPKRKPAETRAELKRRLCGVKEFQSFMWRKHGDLSMPSPSRPDASRFREMEYKYCSHRVKVFCGIEHTAELDTDPEAAKRWDALHSEYLQQAGRMAEKR